MAEKTLVKIDLPAQRTEKHSGEVSKLALYLETQRGSRGGVESVARAGWINPDGMFTFAIGRKGDFYKFLFSKPESRATQTKIDAQHAAVFTAAIIDDLKREVLDYYRGVQFDWFTYEISAC